MAECDATGGLPRSPKMDACESTPDVGREIVVRDTDSKGVIQDFDAAALAEQILPDSFLNPFRSGLFLHASAPQEKSLLHAIRSRHESTGGLVLVADMTHTDRDAAELVADAVIDALSRTPGSLQRLRHDLGRSEASETDLFDHISFGAEGRITLSDAFEALSDASGKLIVLFILGSDRVLESESGRNTTFALKAARDALMFDKRHGLQVIVSGSDEGVLKQFCQHRHQAFYGARFMSLR